MGNCFTEQDYEEDRYRRAHYKEQQQQHPGRGSYHPQSGEPWNDGGDHMERGNHRFVDEREYMDQKYRRNDDPHHFDPYAPATGHARLQSRHADGWDYDHQTGAGDHFSNQDYDLMSHHSHVPSIGGGDLSGHTSSAHQGRKYRDFEVRSNLGGAMDYMESKSLARDPSVGRYSENINSVQATHEAYISPRLKAQNMQKKYSMDGYDDESIEKVPRHPLYPFEQNVRSSHGDMPRKKSLQERITHYRQRKVTEEKSYDAEHDYREIIRNNSMKRSSDRPEDDEEDSFDYATNGRKKSLQQRVEEFKYRRKHSQVRFEDESESQAEARNNQHRPESLGRARGYEGDRQNRPERRRNSRSTRGGNEDARGPSAHVERRVSEDLGTGPPPRKNSRSSKAGGRKSLNKYNRERDGDQSGRASMKRNNSTASKHLNSPLRSSERGRSSERRPGNKDIGFDKQSSRKPSVSRSTRSSRSKANNTGDQEFSKLDLKERIKRRSHREQPQEFVLHE